MTEPELTSKEKAQRVLKARDEGDPRFIAFVVLMQTRTGLPPEVIVAKVEELARGDEHGG